MRPIFLIITALLVASLAVPVAAQENATVPGVDADETTGDCTEHVDRFVSICSAEYRDGSVVLELRSDRRETVTITDAGGIITGGEILRQDHIVRADRRTTIRMPVTEAGNGFVGVTIDTGRTLYGVPIEQSSTLIGGPWTYSDAQAAALGGGIGTAAVVLISTLRTLLGKETGIERLA